jgi:hypothetical protein
MQILNGRDAGCSLGSSHTWVTEQQRTAGKSAGPARWRAGSFGAKECGIGCTMEYKG